MFPQTKILFHRLRQNGIVHLAHFAHHPYFQAL